MFKLTRAFCMAAACTFGMASFSAAEEPPPPSTAANQNNKPVSPACQQLKSPEKLDITYKVYAEAYQDAVYYTKADKVASLETIFKDIQLPPAAVQLIRNEALLYAARVSPGENIALALKYRADLCVTDQEGRGIGEIIMEKPELSRLAVIKKLHEKYHYDLTFLSKKPQFFFKLFMQAHLPDREENAVEALGFLQGIGIDIARLREPDMGLNLLHIAARSDSHKILKFIKDKNIQFSPWDKKGKHVLDYADQPETRRILEQELGFSKSDVQPTAGNKSEFDIYQAFLKNMGERVIRAPNQIPEPRDFSMYKNIVFDRQLIPDNALVPILIVNESVLLDKDNTHIESTNRIVFGTSGALGAKGLPRTMHITTTEQNQSSYGENSLTTILKFNKENYVVTSESTGFKMPEDPVADYQGGKNFNSGNIEHLDKRRNVFYTSAGNDGAKLCITVDGTSFCLQPYAEEKHYLQTIRVGAAHEKKDGSITVQYYSSQRPAFCSLLPYKGGKLYAGTSFSAPAAAATERRLADIFARSAAFPEGVVHEDILMALMLTARAEGLIDETTGKVIPAARNSAGIMLSDRCGAGVIQPQEAANLLSEMVRWSRENPDTIKPTEMQTVHFDVEKPAPSGDDRYIYSVTIPQDGILVSMRAGFPFEEQKKGAVLLQIGEAEPMALDLSQSGLTTEYRLAGHAFKKGDVIRIITTKPLFERKGSWPDTKGFIDLRMAQPSSPIKKAIEHMRPKNPPPAV